MLEQTRPRPAQGPQARSPVGETPVQAHLLWRLQGLDATDPDRLRKAFRMFMEATLAHALGAQVQTDPQFPGLVDQVLERMDADPGLGAASLEAAQWLLAQAASAGVAGPQTPAT